MIVAAKLGTTSNTLLFHEIFFRLAILIESHIINVNSSLISLA